MFLFQLSLIKELGESACNGVTIGPWSWSQRMRKCLFGVDSSLEGSSAARMRESAGGFVLLLLIS